MGDASSPYSVLGLQPGASRAAVDQAYRRLIKQHHPDRKGGNPARASALNRAYAMLKDGDGIDAQSVRVSLQTRSRKQQRRWWPMLLFVAAVAAGSGAFVTRWQARSARPLTPSIEKPLPQLPPEQGSSHALQVDRRAVSAGVTEALRFARAGQWDEAAAYQAGCTSDLERFGSLRLVDHCVAFERALHLLRPDGKRSATNQQLQVALALTRNRVLAQSRIDLAGRSAEHLVIERQAAAQR